MPIVPGSRSCPAEVNIGNGLSEEQLCSGRSCAVAMRYSLPLGFVGASPDGARRMHAALQIAFAAASVAVVVVIAYFLHTCSREATPIPPMAPPPAAATAAAGDVEMQAGMDEAAISALPRVVVAQGGREEASCAVCLGEYDRGDVLRVLPGCDHSFHRPCVDQWLRLRPSCPVCRTPPAPSPAQPTNH